MIPRSTLYQFTARLIVIVHLAVILALVGAVVMPGNQAAAQDSRLGTAASFVVLAGTTVTNTGPTVIGDGYFGGDLGVFPGSSVTNFPPGTVVAPGTIYAADLGGVAAQAQIDNTAAYGVLAGEPCDVTGILSGDLNGDTLVPGVYCFDSTALFTTGGTLTLNLQGDPNSLFIFKIPADTAALVVQSGFTVSYINGSAPCNVWWQVADSVTIGTNAQFVGNILALTSISLDTGATLLPGRVFAQTGAVTLDTNTINVAACNLPPTPTPTNTPVPTNTPTPTPPPPTDTPTPTPSPTPIAISLPATGYPHRPDYWLPVVVSVSSGLLVLVVSSAWTVRRRSKLH